MSNSQIELINEEVNRELAGEETGRALLATTFKGLNPQSMKQAIIEGMLRGFKFKDFLEKNVYAIPFKDGYSLVTSIDYARKKGMRAGVTAKSAPQYEMDGKNIVSCTVTIKRRVGQDLGEYTATVYFDEYSTGKNLWVSKPRTMIAKVAEMHALRMACPEELSQNYTEEELDAENGSAEPRMHPYTVARVIPAEEDEPQGHRTHKHIRDEAPTSTKDGEASTVATEPITGNDIIPPATTDVKEMKMEIARLLKEKAKFTMLGKSQQVISDKIFDLIGCTYSEENYAFIIEELKNL